jgi:PAS domain S-box-containing protein
MANLKINLGTSENRYDRLLRYLTDYIYTVRIENGKAVETHHGPGCFAVTGYRSEDYASDPDLWHRMVHNEDKYIVLKRAEQAIQGIDQKPLEHRIIHSDGSVRWVRNSIVLYKDESGKVLSYDGLINDITELKKAEEQTESKQRQLIQADKMATLGTMVSGIAHEVNNPNNFILLNARFLQKVWEDIIPVVKEYSQAHEDFSVAGFPVNKSTEKIVQSLEGIINGALRIQKITKSLTNFARVDAGELDHPVDINSVISNAVLLTGNVVKNSTDNFSVKCNYEKNLPLIKGNAQQLEQVIINLITNACQALTNKSQKITIILSIYDQPPAVSIKIEDDGVGVDKENLKHIFDPFFTTKRSSGGTGLGLYVSYKIIKDHGGDLTVKSEKGKGTKCEITLPIT